MLQDIKIIMVCGIKWSKMGYGALYSYIVIYVWPLLVLSHMGIFVNSL
jgi:hypothetical protein